jgi:uncharacterized tellurite resistance protein B-like protein
MVRFLKIDDTKLSAFLEETKTLSLSPVYPIHSLPKDPTMRSYPRNSPKAAARILALVLVSDGNVCRSEFEALNQLDGMRHLGLDPQKLPGIVQTFCEDLLMEGFDGRSILSHVGDGLMASVLAEVDEPKLRKQVLYLAESVAHADKHLSEGETAMIQAIRGIWQTSPVKAGAVKAEINFPALAHAG